MSDDVTPFRVDVPEASLADLRERLRRTRWPEPETVTDWSQGTPLAYVRELCRYWLMEYEWPAAQARLNRFPQFLTRIDDLDIHFVHVRSPHPGATPLVMTHGWPGSVVEFRKVIDPLTDPVAFGGSAADAFHLVCPTLPGFGFSGKPAQPGWGVERIADAWDQLMGRLGYPRYGAQGGDWGSLVTAALGRRHPGPGARGAPEHGGRLPRPRHDRRPDRARAGRRWPPAAATAPRAPGTPRSSRPARRASATAWSTPRPRCAPGSRRSSRPGATATATPAPSSARDEMLDNIMLYWLTGSGASAARLYWESYARRSSDPVPVPAGASIFPKEIYRPSRRWAEPLFTDLRYWNELDRGGHFAALEQPALFIDEVRAAFRLFRD